MNENVSLTKPLPEKKSRKGKSARKVILKPLYPPIGKSVVVVESVAKAKVIQGYLGDMYKVLPSYGHMRDLAARRGSVRPDDDFSMVWEVPSSAWTHLESIKVALSGYEVSLSKFSAILSWANVLHLITDLWSIKKKLLPIFSIKVKPTVSGGYFLFFHLTILFPCFL